MSANLQFDRFDARFADSSGRGVRFLVDSDSLLPLLQSGIAGRVARIARLPYIVGDVTLYADATVKPFGFPAGIMVRTEPEWAYPMAAPDMGCGYLVVDAGIEVSDRELDGGAAERILGEIVAATDIRSTDRVISAPPVVEILKHGLVSVGAPKEFSTGDCPAEENNSWESDVGALDRDFVASTLQMSLGTAAGHFVACYLATDVRGPVSLPEGRLIVVVHIGAAPIRDHLNSSAFYARLAELAIDSGVSTVEDTADGLFAVNLSTAEGRSFIGSSMASRNFGYANRQIVGERVVGILRSALAGNVVDEAKQLRHVDHVAFEMSSGLVRSRRGLQPLHESRPIFLTGGEHTHGYLAISGSNIDASEGLCCHGAPVRDANALSPSIWDSAPGRSPDPGRLYDWGQRMVSNTTFNRDRFWSDVANLEGVRTYLSRSDVIRPVALLRPFVNYRDLGL